MSSFRRFYQSVGWVESAEVTADGVFVDVVEGCLNTLRGIEIAIIARPFLPEAEGDRTGTLVNGESIQQRAVALLKPLPDLSGCRTFDVGQKSREIYFCGQRGHEQVDVFRHENICQQTEGVTLAGSIYRRSQIGLPEVVGE